MDEITQNVIDPQTNVSVYDRKKAHDVVSASSAKDKKEILDRKGGRLESLGRDLITLRFCNTWVSQL